MARNVEDYVDAIGDFTPKDIKETKKSGIKGTVLQEVEGHKGLIQGKDEGGAKEKETPGTVDKEFMKLCFSVVR